MLFASGTALGEEDASDRVDEMRARVGGPAEPRRNGVAGDNWGVAASVRDEEAVATDDRDKELDTFGRDGRRWRCSAPVSAVMDDEEVVVGGSAR